MNIIWCPGETRKVFLQGGLKLFYRVELLVEDRDEYWNSKRAEEELDKFTFKVDALVHLSAIYIISRNVRTAWQKLDILNWRPTVQNLISTSQIYILHFGIWMMKSRMPSSKYWTIIINIIIRIVDNLLAAQTWQRNLPPPQVIIKYQQKSQMKCMSHKFNWYLKCQGISSGYW